MNAVRALILVAAILAPVPAAWAAGRSVSLEATVTMPAADVEVTATYVDAYTLTVNDGWSDGVYPAGEVVHMYANASPSGMAFGEWVGDIAVLADQAEPHTTVTMPAWDVEVTATYIGPCWRGDVNEDEFCGQADLDIILDQWGCSGGEIIDGRADVNGDDFVGQTDLDYVMDDWGKTGRQPWQP